MAEEADDDTGAPAPDDNPTPSVEGADAPPSDAPADDDFDRKAAQAVAKRLGWKPQDAWKGDTSKWVDADEFIAAQAQNTKSLKEQISRVTRVADQAVKDAKRRALEEARREVREAHLSGDDEAVEAAAKRLEAVASEPEGPPEPVQDFMARSPWFNVHRSATEFALVEGAKAASRGASPEEEVAAVEAAVRRKFPELFDDEAPVAPKPKTPPVMNGGQRSNQPTARAKGVAELPSEARKAGEKLIRSGMYDDVPPERRMTEYAKDYWQENAA